MRTLLIVFLLVAVLSVAMAKTYHYRIDSNGNKVPDDAPESVQNRHGHNRGSIFDTAASLINGVI